MGKRFSYFHAAQIRIARPTGQLDEIIRFYEEGLGLKRIGEFSKHNGYDRVMYGLPRADYHLEFTQLRGKAVPLFPIPTVSSFFMCLMLMNWQRSRQSFSTWAINRWNQRTLTGAMEA